MRLQINHVVHGACIVGLIALTISGLSAGKKDVISADATPAKVESHASRFARGNTFERRDILKDNSAESTQKRALTLSQKELKDRMGIEPGESRQQNSNRRSMNPLYESVEGESIAQTMARTGVKFTP